MLYIERLLHLSVRTILPDPSHQNSYFIGLLQGCRHLFGVVFDFILFRAIRRVLSSFWATEEDEEEKKNAEGEAEIEEIEEGGEDDVHDVEEAHEEGADTDGEEEEEVAESVSEG